MNKKYYNFQNFYIITNYSCNLNCKFCLFKYNKIKETKETIFLNKIKKVLKNNNKIYIKITGGEPFLKKNLLKNMFKLFQDYKNKIYKIGIGSNGTIFLPNFLKTIEINTDIFFSRHNYLKNDFIIEDSIKNFKNINIKLNCNLIKKGIDNKEKIIKYINIAKKYNVKGICFRELNKITLDHKYMYEKYIYDYKKYYIKNLVKIEDIITSINKNSNFKQTKITGNFYDTNIWYYYQNNFSIKFRKIEENKLIEFNKKTPNKIDEYVLHPDGLLTGCWDRTQKIIS